MRPFSYLILNSLTTVMVLVLNFLAGTGTFFPRNVGEVSADFPTLITPAGYAFAIWGIIYLGWVMFVAYQWYTWSIKREDVSLRPSAEWVTMVNIANMVWLYLWTMEMIGWALLVMFFLLYGLIRLTIRLRLEVWNAPLPIIAFVWWPVAIYLGWIITATVANTTIFLVSLGWDGAPLSGEIWAMVVLLVATLIYLFLIWKRNLRESALVGVWALVAIAWADHSPWVNRTAIILAVILFLSAGIHALKNNPMFRSIRS